ncbi:2-oxoglutarate dehydrogenase E1 component [Nitrospirillum viridazoti]|uniref:2-oxoglutarate dehydrogenase E1 component n=1 Tax=Nitrospirillum viridazoti CBAmc TaxID=1441467 RepID=A0A248JR98_9PROT|nr:2-oxoglutarate dehydrogenase E1 component [Nitrospirillum amazonense]ASG21262.1 2-oxoglutarate dehydrogenase E1 component [Nitrospirillum amazonense CBAmc]TWB32260.1 2-oxoglutarate dehydrogenase E1 component [Nitrospirillum amazonense]
MVTDQSSLFFAGNATFVAELYARYLQDPASVDPSWSSFFAGLDDDARVVLGEIKGASWAPNKAAVIGVPDPDAKPAAPAKGAKGANGAAAPAANGSVVGGITPEQLRQAQLDSIRALMLIRAYRVRGHLMAKLDPLGLEKRSEHPELDPKTYGFTDADLDRPIFINNVLGMETATLRQIVDAVQRTYCGHIGVEFMHIQDPEQKAWIQERIEGIRNQTDFTVQGKKAILQRLTAAEGFERFLQLKYTGTKRFGLEGGEVWVPAIEQILKRGGQLGLKELVIGMAHRGRLNVLANVMNKPYKAIFSEFQGNAANPEDVQGSGDVKYHLGTSADREFDGNSIHLSLTANPSHLEVVNPVVCGKVRAKQVQRSTMPPTDEARAEVIGLLLHGDAAFAGQGLVPETLLLSELKGYRTGGIIHIITNNQIGFTTAPQYARSGPYPTEVAKAIQAPIFHVNGDDPEAVIHVTRIAVEFRQKFLKDVVLDIVCYRRQGHNEGDEPAFTQPLMYKAIRNHPTTRELYAKQLIAEGVITAEEADGFVKDFHKAMEAEFEASTTYKPNKADWLEGKWQGLSAAKNDDRKGKTAAPMDLLQEVGKAISAVPEGVDVNAKVVRQLKAKQEMFATGKDLDWATAEALAFGTLLVEGVPVRLSGQDVGRGTFSHRHCVLVDQTTEAKYVPLDHIRAPDHKEGQARFEVHDSPLSEAAVLGFEYGFTLAEPHALVLWEAQFGDFANGAQSIIDQFISSGESKWLRMSGLTMLLPHGYEGQGPEHSSARLERFLQLSGEDNWQIVNCTTPANYFHVLRRQVNREFRKPLVVFSPKSLLRHKLCVSELSMFTGNESFHRVLYETGVDLVEPAKIRRVVLCSGKVYYDLFQERENRGVKDVAFLRLEQLYPFPGDALKVELAKYPNADVVWCQEEPANMGAWSFVDRRIEGVLKELNHKAGRPSYVGRAEAASPAAGQLKRHNQELAKFLDEALTIA